MDPNNESAGISADTLSGQKLHIPDLRPTFAAWKQGVNPLHAQARQAADIRLAGLIEDEKALAKTRAVDIALFASMLAPDVGYAELETVTFYYMWLFLWDDAIDGADEGEVAAEEYCRQSIAFVEHSLGLAEPGAPAPAAPTKVCESFAEVGRRVGGYCGLEERERFSESLRMYMEACVTEYRWRLSGRVPSVEEFYSWRLGTSSVDAMLDLSRVIHGVKLPRSILDSKELTAMGFCVNKLLILINELVSLKKELKDGAFGNLIPITMRASKMNLESATQSLTKDIQDCVRDFESNVVILRRNSGMDEEQLKRLVQAYQVVDTATLNFSIQSPRYGILKDRQTDGSFVVTL
ncbi:isoprenoid synthase domain-containing protein [Chaetomium tenue]|uniref:Isoprenoid synthase domain-containing protein n=1 Tax=Chaetomium tenue TaxID=1854479 RepID=A0ACB7NW35_9PEZI|nr:isoprenoid synthase domain-containing protein [Chaetomium globosum]